MQTSDDGTITENIAGIPCHKCDNGIYYRKDGDETKVICDECGDERDLNCSETWAILEGLRYKMDYEGGMAETIFSYSDSGFFDVVGDKKLSLAAKNAKEAWNKLQKEWERVCEENNVCADT